MDRHISSQNYSRTWQIDIFANFYIMTLEIIVSLFFPLWVDNKYIKMNN